MPLSDDQFSVIRVWVGSDPSDDVLDERFSRLGSVDKLIIEEINAQLADLQSQPSSISVPGLSVSFGDQIRALQEALKRFMAQGGSGLDTDTTLGFAVARMVRADLR